MPVDGWGWCREGRLVASALANLQPLPTGFFRRLVTLLLASTLVLVLAGSAVASIDAPRPLMMESGSERAWVPNDVADVALVIADLDGLDPIVDAVIVPNLRNLPGVSAVASEVLDNGRVSLLISLDDGAHNGAAADSTIDSITSTVTQFLPTQQVSVGGRAVVDSDLVSRLNRGLFVAVVPVMVLLSLIVAISFGARLALATAGTVGLSAALGGALGARVAGSFDGTLATTAAPSVLVAVLVSAVLTFRLLDWFKHPQGADMTDAIRNSIRHLLPEAALLFGGLVATAAVMELIGSGRASATVVAVGGLIAAVVTLGTLPSMLATMPPVRAHHRIRFLRLPTPDGRDFPPGVLIAFACFLLGLSVFAMRVPSSDMLDADALPAGEASRRVAEQLLQSGGDPSDAIVATIPATVAAERIDAWAESVSLLNTVGWVETAAGRWEAGSLSDRATVPDRFVIGDAAFAIVSPTVTGRSAAAQTLVTDLEMLATTELAIDIDLAGVPVDAVASDGGAVAVAVLVLLLAVTGGVTAYLLLDDLLLAAVTTGLRVLGTGASLGVYALVSATVSSGELQVLALIVNVGVAWFEIGFLRRIGIGRALYGSPMVLVGDALRREGRAAMLGLGVTALVGLGFLTSDLEMARRLGLAVAAGVVIELLVGIWLLRPVVLGERAAGIVPERTAARRLLRAEAIAAGPPPAPAEAAMDPGWRRIVAGLLRSEFECQSHPQRAELSTVFVESTPLYDEVLAHTSRLRDGGLSIVGAPPVLRSLSAVNTSSPVALAVTVEHPERFLVDSLGREIGRRPAKTRDGMLWLVQDPSGRYRIAEAVDLGETAIVDLTAGTTGAPEPAIPAGA